MLDKAILLAACAGALAAGAAAMGRRPPKNRNSREAAPMEWSGSFCAVTKPGEEIVTTEKEWRNLWARLGSPAPAADFSRYFAAAVFLGVKRTGGYGVIFEDLRAEKAAAVVRYRVRAPAGMAIEALTQPYAVRLYPKTALPVRFEKPETAR